MALNRGSTLIVLRTIVLPAYNESGYIGEMVTRTLEAASRRNDPVEVIVIDNASLDDTAAIVERISARDQRVRVIRHPVNRLYAGSCLTGTRAARGERVFIIDADGQHPPDDIWKFDAKLDEGYDIVFGWRRKRSEPRLRLLLSRALLVLTRLYLGFHLHDVNCGIRAFNRAYADAVEIRHRVNFVNPELYLRARSGGFRIGEVEVVQEARRAGATSHNFQRLWQTFLTVNRYLLSLRRELGARGSQ